LLQEYFTVANGIPVTIKISFKPCDELFEAAACKICRVPKINMENLATYV